jgi:hypothetical protein
VPECADDDGMVSVGRIISSDVDHSGTTLQDVSDTSKHGLTYVCDNDSSFWSGTGHATLLCCRSDGSPADVYEEDISFTSDVMESIEETETSTEDISMAGAGSGFSADVSFVSKQAEVIFEVSKVSTGVFKAEYWLRGCHDEKSPKTYVVNLRARVLGVLVVNRPIRFSVDRCRITKKVRFEFVVLFLAFACLLYTYTRTAAAAVVSATVAVNVGLLSSIDNRPLPWSSVVMVQ